MRTNSTSVSGRISESVIKKLTLNLQRECLIFGGVKGRGRLFQAEGAPQTRASKYANNNVPREIQVDSQEPSNFIRQQRDKNCVDKKESTTNDNKN